MPSTCDVCNAPKQLMQSTGKFPTVLVCSKNIDHSSRQWREANLNKGEV